MFSAVSAADWLVVTLAVLLLIVTPIFMAAADAHLRRKDKASRAGLR